MRSVYSVSGESKPFVVILSNTTLYITGFKANHTFVNDFILPYSELDTILIGPDSHTVHFSSHANSGDKKQYLLVTGSAHITAEIIGKLEMIMRTSVQHYALPAVRHLTMRDMQCLRRNVCKQTAVQKVSCLYIVT